jgi:hypothetical protein
MLDKIFTKYVRSTLVILSISHGDCGKNSCLDRVGYLDIEQGGTGGRAEEGSEKGAMCGVEVLRY